jgi:hypothetical protein
MRYNRQRMSQDDGTAVLEVIVLGVGLLLPLLYGAISLMSVEAARFAATSAAREAARAYVEGATIPEAQVRAQLAADLVLTDAQLPPVHPQIQCVGGCLVPGSHVNVTIRLPVALPLLSRSAVYVSSTQSMPVDRFREQP